MKESNIILYETDDGKINIDIILKDETIMILEIFHYQEKEQLPEYSKDLGIDLKTIGNKHFGLGVKDIMVAKRFIEDNKLNEKEIIINKGRYCLKLSKDIQEYCNTNNLRIDYVVRNIMITCTCNIKESRKNK